MNQIPKDYLGDSVYADVTTTGDLILTTENGLTASNTIILEPSVIMALENYIVRARAQGDSTREQMEAGHA